MGRLSACALLMGSDEHFSRRNCFIQSWVLIAITLLVTTSDSTDGIHVSNVGRLFSFLPPGINDNHGGGPVLFITAQPSSDEEPIHIQVDVVEAEFSKSMNMNPGETGSVRLPPSAMGQAGGPQRGTVQVQASSPVTVQVMIDTGRLSTDAFLALPIGSLGKEYIASATDPSLATQSVLSITGVCEGTSTVSIKASSNIFVYEGVEYKAGRTLMITLDSGKSVQIPINGVMTGTRITSDKPVAVLLAGTCRPEISAILHCGYTVEQLSPVYALGKKFLLPGSSRNFNCGSVMHVLATRSGTSVQLSGLGLSRKLGRGEQWQLPCAQTEQSTFLVANKPVQLTLYSSGSNTSIDCDRHDDCILRSRFKVTIAIIPPLEQFTDRADFVVWNSEQQFTSYLTVMMTEACNEITSELLITSGQSDVIMWTKEVVFNRPNACVLRAEVPPGTFHMDMALQPSIDATFAVLLYGANGHVTYSMPVTAGGAHLGYISEELVNECIHTQEPRPSCTEHSCHYRGECIETNTGYRCSCISPVFQGENCQTVVDVCSELEYCLNGGTCEPSSAWPSCSCPVGLVGDHCEYDVSAETNLSNQGREFRFTFTETFASFQRPSIVVMTSARNINNTVVSVRVPSTSFIKTFEIPPNKAEVITLPVESISHGSRQQYSGISVSASQDVTVNGFPNSILAVNDGFLALPVKALGTKYHVITARQRKKRPHEKSQIAIVAAYNDTTVFIKTPVSVTFEGHDYASYSMIVAHLQESEVMQLQSQFDLSKVEISSAHPVAVLSGSSCGYTMYEGSDQKSCHFMVEQLPPLRSWGKRFLVTPYLGTTNKQTTLRIIGGLTQSDVRTGVGRGIFLYRVTMFELYITEPTYITATNPVLIVAFSVQGKRSCSSKENECESGMSLPTMSVVPHLNQLTTTATLYTLPPGSCSATINENYISVVASNCSDIRVVSLLSHTDESLLWDTSNTMLQSGGLCVLQKEIPLGLYQVSSISGNGGFSAQLHGFNNRGTAYGFPVTLGSQQQTESELDESTLKTEGRDFVLAFISAGNYWPRLGPRLLITTSTDVTNTTVLISGNNLLIELKLGLHETRVVDIPASMFALDGHNPYPDVAIHVISDNDITVYGMNDAFGSDEGYATVSDGFLTLPVSALGNEYFIATPWPDNQYYRNQFMQFVIINLNDEPVRVDIKLKGSVWFDNSIYYGGSSMSIMLSKMQTAYFKAYEDHMGTHVMSSKPVAIISGCDCGYSYRTNYNDDSYISSPCDHQVEFLTPVTRWGHVFLLAPLQGYAGGGFLVRLIAAHDFTVIRYGEGSTAREHTLEDTADVMSFTVGGQGAVNHTMVQSNQQINLFAFTLHQPLLNCLNENGTCQGSSRPVLFTVPPIRSFKKRITFPSYWLRDADDMANYADIYASCSEAAFIMVNGVVQDWGYPLEEIGESGYCVLRMQLNSKVATAYVVESMLENGKLGAITYGFSTRSGYAFPGGL